jgi:serine/threonine protein phosphatase 1
VRGHETFVIGDIQGCLAEVLDLIEKAALSESDEIVSVGDFVDRGPESPEVLDLFRTKPNMKAIQGNHERKHVRSFHGKTPAALSQRVTREQIGEEAYPAACSFMDALPRFLDLPEAIIVHAFFEPGVALHAQRENVIVGVMSGEEYLRRKFKRPWFELYDGEKPIIVGHHNYTNSAKPLVFKDRVFGIDTSCCHGMALTGIVLPDFRIVSVPAREDHWRKVKSTFAHLRIDGSATLESMCWSRIDELIASGRRAARLPAAATERLHSLERLSERATIALRSLHAYIHDEAQRVLSDVRAETERERGRGFAVRIGKTPLAPLLHRARKGQLSESELRSHFDSPAELFDMARIARIEV